MLLELTFIVLARPLEPPPSDAELTSEDIEALPMIGDVDFFKNSREDPEFEVEYKVMIAGQCSSSTPILLPPYLLNAHLFLPIACRARVSRSTGEASRCLRALALKSSGLFSSLIELRCESPIVSPRAGQWGLCESIEYP